MASGMTAFDPELLLAELLQRLSANDLDPACLDPRRAWEVFKDLCRSSRRGQIRESAFRSCR